MATVPPEVGWKSCSPLALKPTRREPPVTVGIGGGWTVTLTVEAEVSPYCDLAFAEKVSAVYCYWFI